MALFSKKCKVCKCKLPDKRKYTNVCDKCGMEIKRISKQIDDSIRIVNETKNPVTGYDRCLLILSLTEQYHPYVDAGMCRYPHNMCFEEMKNKYISRAEEFGYEVRSKNETKKAKQIIGIPPLYHYKNLQNPKITLDTKSLCKACGLFSRFNDSKYCLTCLCMGITVNKEELEKYCLQQNIPYSEDNGTVSNAIKQKVSNKYDNFNFNKS